MSSQAAHRLKYAPSVSPSDKLPVLSGATGRLDHIEIGNTWFGKSEPVCCVFRIENSGGDNTINLLSEWNDGGHEPVNVSSVDISSTVITVNFSKTFSGIGVVCAGPDEAYAGRYLFGVTQGLSSCDITVTEMDGTAVNPLTDSTIHTYTNCNVWVAGAMPAT